MECVSIELCINRGNSIIVTCVYRTCGSRLLQTRITAYSANIFTNDCSLMVLKKGE